jgi:hypothetical protein
LEAQVTRLANEAQGLDLLKKMLIYSPSARISAKAAIAHPFFDDLDLTSLAPVDHALV